ncbi:MAG: epoxyqueuosine reductase, partial [Phototrophicaceae bacterium]
MAVSSEALKSQALGLGFNLVGIVAAEPSPTFDAYLRWIGNGMHADMGYMARPDRIVRRQDLQVILPGVRSMVVVGVDYRAEVPESLLTDPARGRFAAYAWHLDYHEWLLPRLEALAAMLGGQPSCAYVDTGALLERSHGWQAGLGFIGKNTLLIHPQRGSYFFLGELLTTLEFDTYDTPTRPTMCGNCTRCLTACPTDAFPAPHVLDS